MAITNNYLSVLLECTFIYKLNTNEFVTNCNCTIESLLNEYKRGSRFKDNRGTFRGVVNRSNGKKLVTFLESKACDLKDFRILDKHKKDISEFTLSEYLAYVRDRKIDDILD